MHENRFNEYRIPSGMLIVFLEKALTLIHMETHLDDVSTHFKYLTLLLSVLFGRRLIRVCVPITDKLQCWLKAPNILYGFL